jgi:hypothetical protein
MDEPKNLIIIRCRTCNGEYYGNATRMTLHPGTEDNLADEISITVRKVAKCLGCKERIDRTRGGMKRQSKFDR